MTGHWLGAPGRHRVDGTFEAVERHRLPSLRYAKGLVVFITAHVTNCHKIIRCKADRRFCQAVRRFRVLAAFFADSDLSLAGRFADT